VHRFNGVQSFNYIRKLVEECLLPLGAVSPRLLYLLLVLCGYDTSFAIRRTGYRLV